MENDITNELKSNVLDVEEFNYLGHFELATKLLIGWQEKAEAANSQGTLKQLNEFANALARIGLYVGTMQERQRSFNVQLSRFRTAKLESDEKVNKIREQIKDLKLEL
tara:strand:- start:3890 stop:4213 length:324 start_codon:yes stop_codon:yes gene_type:complete